MRISTYSQSLTDKFYLNRLQEKMSTHQVQMATGTMFSQISGDPIRANQVLLIEKAKARIEQYQKNIGDVTSSLSNVETVLASAVDLYQKVREDGILASSDTYSTTDRATFAKTVEASIQTLVGIANGRHLGRYVFSGQAIQTEPFTFNGVAVTYQGDTQNMETDVAPSLQIPTTWNGDDVFQGAFDALVSLRDAMNTGVGANIRTAVDQLDATFQKVINTRSEVGVYMKSTEDLGDMYKTEIVGLEEKRSNAEDVDVPQVMMEYMRTQNMQQALVTAMNKMMDNSLVNFFR